MKLEPHASLQAIAAPQLSSVEEDESRYICTDGMMTSWDVAKAAHCSVREARRAVDAYCSASENNGQKEEDGATVKIDKVVNGVPVPATQTRAQMARIVAERIGIGRFALKGKIAQREEEKRMSASQHAWNLGTHGRHVGSKQGGGVVATLTCSRCPTVEVIEFRQLAAPDAMDRKFFQKGWAVDPARCPEHNRHNHKNRKGESVAGTLTAPSPAAIAAQARMFSLLQTHFDPELGAYGSGYSDAKLAEECRLSVELVAGVRAQAFGPLKVPAEVQALQDDLKALEDLVNESVGTLQGQVTMLRARVAEVTRKFPA